MNFARALSNNGVGASGNSLADAGMSLSKRVLAKKFEKLLLSAADAYVAGYSSTNTALLGVAGVSAAAGATAWGGLKAWGHTTKNPEEEEGKPSRAGMVASFVALIVFALVFAVVTTARRQNTFATLVGDSMVVDYAKFITIPLALLFVGLRVAISSDKMATKYVLLLASALSGAFFAAAKKYYLVFKLNGIERDVFSTLASVFDACKAQGPSGCNHEHAGFLKVFGQINTVLQNNLRMVFGDIDYAEISRELSKAQFYDNIAAFTG